MKKNRIEVQLCVKKYSSKIKITHYIQLSNTIIQHPKH